VEVGAAIEVLQHRRSCSCTHGQNPRADH